MPEIFDNLYAYVHPMGANANIYVFKDGQNLDLIDSGIGIGVIFRWLLKSMRKDGLDPRNIRNIIHCHVHPDHTHADCKFQKRAKKNKGNVKIYYPSGDKHRFSSDYDLIKSNWAELSEHFANFPFKKIPFTMGTAKFAGKTLLKYDIPDNLIPFADGQEIIIGERKAKIITTGGHTEGHSFIKILDDDGLLFNSDATCINEFTSDFGNVLRAFDTLEAEKPKFLLGGHDPLHFDNNTWNEIQSSRRRVESMFKSLLEQYASKELISISEVAHQRVGKYSKMGIVNMWAHMSPFCMCKLFEKLDMGSMEIDNSCEMMFKRNNNNETSEYIEKIKNILSMSEDTNNSCTRLFYDQFKEKILN